MRWRRRTLVENGERDVDGRADCEVFHGLHLLVQQQGGRALVLLLRRGQRQAQE